MFNFLHIKTMVQIRLLLIDNLKKAWKKKLYLLPYCTAVCRTGPCPLDKTKFHACQPVCNYAFRGNSFISTARSTI